MTAKEFSDSFDTLLNSYGIQAAFGEVSHIQDIVLDEYEKSIFLTQAQGLLLRQYLGLDTNKELSVLDGANLRAIDLSGLIKTETGSIGASDQPMCGSHKVTFTNGFTVSTNVLAILNEAVGTSGGAEPYSVIPISFTEYSRVMNKPYGGPPKRQIWRIYSGGHIYLTIGSKRYSNNSTLSTTQYYLRYIASPKPICLDESLKEALGLSNFTADTPCELPEYMHSEILLKAVELAVAAKTRTLGTLTTAARAQQSQQARDNNN